jgi:uncharacterized protein YndB with AHSA1/START domain
VTANDSFPDDLGHLERRHGQVAVTFTRHIPHPPAVVWQALTEPEHLAAWFPTTIEGERAAGARLHFGFRDGEAPPFDGEMVQYEPESSMTMRWGDDVLRFELRALDTGSVLTLRATFDEMGKGARDGAGWHTCLDLLGYAVGDRRAPWSSAERWRQVHPIYVDRFGPEAATIGPPPEWEQIHGSGDETPELR